jgi:single-strand DNA-binding protein
MVCFGKSAEILNQYVGKGALLYVEGRLVTRTWEKDGHKNYRTEIHIENFQLPPKGMSGDQNGAQQSAPAKPQTQGSSAPDYPDEEINPEDIPF